MPRFFYFFNLALYLVYLVSYSISSKSDVKNGFDYSLSKLISFVLLVYFSAYELIQFFYIALHENGLLYFQSVKNLIEFLNFSCCFAAIFISNEYSIIKLSLYSMTVLFGYLIFLFRLDKIPLIGVYVVVFKKVFQKSLKLIPLVLVLFVGFLLSFQIRSTGSLAPVVLFNGTWSNSAVHLLTMLIGQFELDQLGLEDEMNKENSVNYIILIFFIFIMTIFFYNLFIGIAVDEIQSIVDDAEIQNIKAKIEFVIKFQALASFTGWKMLQKCTVFESYDYNQDERNFVKIYKLIRKILFFLVKKQKSLHMASYEKSKENGSISKELDRINQEIKLIKTALIINNSNKEMKEIIEQVEFINKEMQFMNTAFLKNNKKIDLLISQKQNKTKKTR